MKTSYRLEVLEQKHKNLHERIEALEAENAPDHMVTKLKKEKLAIKDEMEKLVWPNQDSGLEDMS